MGEERGEDVISQVVDNLLVDVVLDLEEAVARGLGALHSFVPDVLACLDILGIVVEIARGVEIKVDGMIAKCCEDVLAVLFADGIWRSVA